MEQKIKRIVGLAFRVSTTSNADVFVDYTPHICALQYRIFWSGWKAYGDPDKAETIYLDDEGAMQKLDKLIETLRNLLEFGTLKVERNGKK